jgi:hypothetical protein
MPDLCSSRPIPRGFIDPIESATDALAVLSLAAPFGHDTVAVLLDSDRRGVGILVVTDTRDDEAIFRIIDVCVGADYTEIGGLILATSRPGGDVMWSDASRWRRASRQCDDGGIEMVEWFVIGEHVCCPRDLAGDEPRWGRRRRGTTRRR